MVVGRGAVLADGVSGKIILSDLDHSEHRPAPEKDLPVEARASHLIVPDLWPLRTVPLTWRCIDNVKNVCGSGCFEYKEE